jgi:hypothetical protein
MKAMGQSSYNQTNGAVVGGSSTTTSLVAAASTFSTSVTPISIVGNGTTAVITVPASSAMPVVGSTLNVSGVTSSGFNNASATVTAVTNNTISYANGTSGTASVNGTVVYVPSLVGRKLNYQPNVAGAATGAATTIVSAAQATTNITGTVAAGSGTAPTVILTVTVTSATIYPGMVLGTASSGGTFATPPTIVSQLTGTTGSTGTYLLSVGNTASAATYTAVATAGAYVTITTTASHSLTTNDIVTLTGFTSATGTINGVYPVIAVGSATTFSINTGYGNVLGAITTTAGNITAQYTAQITANTSTTLTIQDIVNALALPYAPTTGCSYSVGLIDRGQLLPQSLVLTSDVACYVELIASTPTAQLGLAGANFQPEANLGSIYSFAERDVSAGYLSGGEVVQAFLSPTSSGLLQIDLTNFFPVLTNIKGNIPDILTIAVSTTASTKISANVICQESMS